jgi:chromosome segregation ATPase
MEILELLDIETELDKCGNDTDRIVTWVDSYARDIIDAIKELYVSSVDLEEEIREKDKKVERLNDEISGNIDVITSLNDIIDSKNEKIDKLEDELDLIKENIIKVGRKYYE